ncbi:MAG TPA: Gfo/Idh/MocA family oxidoreductase [Alloacidobacterium sp.]|nr:Gfo/Idh/MocA family oxidoreductase [Alloacidobacterium sp.]
MYLTLEQQRIGQQNFWRTVGPELNPERMKLETCVPRQFSGGAVRAGIVGVGSQGAALLSYCLPEFIDVVAICDINPAHRAKACQGLAKGGWRQPREYTEWREMKEKEKLEMVIIATPLWTHAEIAVGFLEAGIHVFCEKMMAHDEEGCRQMIAAAEKHHRHLEIGYPRFYDVLHTAMYKSIILPKLLGDIHFVRLFSHNNESWRKHEQPPFPGFDPKPWGYPDWEHLMNWRMYDIYSRGLTAEWGSHITSFTDWFLGSTPISVYGSGGIYHYKDGREVDDHLFITYDHPGGCKVELSLILTNNFYGNFEEFIGSEGTVIFNDTSGLMYFPNESCASREGDKYKDLNLDPWNNFEIAFRTEIWNFCSAVRHGNPLNCGAARGLSTVIGCLAGIKAARTRSRVAIETL